MPLVVFRIQRTRLSDSESGSGVRWHRPEADLVWWCGLLIVCVGALRRVCGD